VEYTTYSLDARDIPLFLKDYVLAEIDSPIPVKGLYKEDENNDLETVLSQKLVSLDATKQNINPLIRPKYLTVDIRYLAVVEINIIDRNSSKRVWAVKYRDSITCHPMNICMEMMLDLPSRKPSLKSWRLI
tara:strand:- start:14636 stop:15028 length:393 start_codon:yes stop_codon:yes gene_type:complete